jgi:hypothetical protein
MRENLLLRPSLHFTTLFDTSLLPIYTLPIICLHKAKIYTVFLEKKVYKLPLLPKIRYGNAFSTVQQPLVGQAFLIVDASRSHSDTPHSVGLLWTSDQPDAESYEKITDLNS